MTLYSHSRLSTFEQCPLKFRFRYIDKISVDTAQSIEAFLGSRVHETLEKLYIDLKFQKTNTLPDLIKYFSDQWKKNWNQTIKIVKKDYTEENYRKMGEKFITDYYNRYMPFNDTRILGIENRVVIDLNGDGKFKLQGYIDRLAMKGEDTVEIHDYKTNSNLPLQDYLDRDRQLALYAIAVQEAYPFAKKIRLVWHFLAFDKEMVSSRTEKQLDSLKKETVTLIKTIESTDTFEPNESALCGWCEFTQFCPRKKHEIMAEALPAGKYKDESGVKLVNKYVELKDTEKLIHQELEDLKQALFNYGKKNSVDNITGSDMVARLRKYINIRLPGRNDEDQKKVIDILKKTGAWDNFSALDTFALSKAMKDKTIDADIQNKLSKFAKEAETKMVYLGKK
ncbi:MAG: PD-(D/E)XK nuclease family protein [Candidatus Aenigmarchaeota archaeon]|nr:PD-(D/E)XK nuclease family protein [Candidatus Aenigmarchaeota archaeon]